MMIGRVDAIGLPHGGNLYRFSAESADCEIDADGVPTPLPIISALGDSSHDESDDSRL